MNIFKFLETGKKGNGLSDMVIFEMGEVEKVVEFSKNSILNAIDTEAFLRKKDASFALRLLCLNVLEDLKNQGKVVSYESPLVLRTESPEKLIPRYDLEYTLAFRIKDGTVHKYIYCDDVLERKYNA